jgi:hypothetical protein
MLWTAIHRSDAVGDFAATHTPEFPQGAILLPVGLRRSLVHSRGGRPQPLAERSTDVCELLPPVVAFSEIEQNHHHGQMIASELEDKGGGLACNGSSTASHTMLGPWLSGKPGEALDNRRDLLRRHSPAEFTLQARHLGGRQRPGCWRVDSESDDQSEHGDYGSTPAEGREVARSLTRAPAHIQALPDFLEVDMGNPVRVHVSIVTTGKVEGRVAQAVANRCDAFGGSAVSSSHSSRELDDRRRRRTRLWSRHVACQAVGWRTLHRVPRRGGGGRVAVTTVAVAGGLENRSRPLRVAHHRSYGSESTG